MRFGPKARPHAALDEAMRVLGLTLDKQLAIEAGIHFTTLSSIRHGRRPVCDATLLQLHDATGIPIRRLKELAGTPISQE